MQAPWDTVHATRAQPAQAAFVLSQGDADAGRVAEFRVRDCNVPPAMSLADIAIEEDFCMTNHLSEIRVLTFDVFGTVTDWRGSIIREGVALGCRQGFKLDWSQFALDWRSGYQPAMQRVRSGELPWTSIDDLHRMILNDLLAKYDIDGLSEEETAHFNRVWHRLSPWPDVRTGLARLRSRYTLSTLSNGNIALLNDLAKHADLRFDCILSAELAQHYKPDPEVYLNAAALLGLRPEQVMMVAAHNSDLAGARQVGLRTAFIYRRNEYGPEQTTDLIPQPGVDVVADDLHDLADQLFAD